MCSAIDPDRAQWPSGNVSGEAAQRRRRAKMERSLKRWLKGRCASQGGLESPPRP